MTKVQYHNDLHGTDVMQHLFVMLTVGNLIEIGELDHIDTVSLLIAGACHDYNHDGFTNTYHIHKMSDRAVRYHDESVQENHHAANSIKLMLREENNFMHDMS